MPTGKGWTWRLTVAGVALAAAGSGLEECPTCHSPRPTADARFCEVCRYDFVKQAAGGPPVVATAAPQGDPAETAAAAAPSAAGPTPATASPGSELDPASAPPGSELDLAATPSALRHGASAPGRSCERLASGSSAEHPTPASASLPRSSRSLSSRPKDCRTARSESACSSRIALSGGTCIGSSPSSTSRVEHSCATP